MRVHSVPAVITLDRGFSRLLLGIDAELPIQCDDEFWENEDSARAFVQPEGKPSLITFFNCYLRLNNVLAFGLKMLVRIAHPRCAHTCPLILHPSMPSTRPKSCFHTEIKPGRDISSRKLIRCWTAGLRASLPICSGIQIGGRRSSSTSRVFCSAPITRSKRQSTAPLSPRYGRASPLPQRDPSSGIGFLAHYITQSLRSFAICTNAARSCSHIAEMSRLRKNGLPAPVLIVCTTRTRLTCRYSFHFETSHQC